MIKYLFLIHLLICSSFLFQENEILQYEYKVSTRGVFKEVTISRDSTIIIDTKGERIIETKKHDWLLLNKKIIQIDLKKLDSFDAPTDDRYSDKALSGQFSVVTKNQSFHSNEFDHGNSPIELREIIKLMTQYLDSE